METTTKTNKYIVELSFPNGQDLKPRGYIDNWNAEPVSSSFCNDFADGYSEDIATCTFDTKDDAVEWISKRIKAGYVITITDYTDGESTIQITGAPEE